MDGHKYRLEIRIGVVGFWIMVRFYCGVCEGDGWIKNGSVYSYDYEMS